MSHSYGANAHEHAQSHTRAHAYTQHMRAHSHKRVCRHHNVKMLFVYVIIKRMPRRYFDHGHTAANFDDRFSVWVCCICMRLCVCLYVCVWVMLGVFCAISPRSSPLILDPSDLGLQPGITPTMRHHAQNEAPPALSASLSAICCSSSTVPARRQSRSATASCLSIGERLSCRMMCRQ